jgi:hypothetical protein
MFRHMKRRQAPLSQIGIPQQKAPPRGIKAQARNPLPGLRVLRFLRPRHPG